MRPFVINTYDYSAGVGGIKVMHKLCDILNNNGFEAYLMPINIRDDFYTCADYNTPLITQEILNNIEEAIVIYPEGIHGNPLEAKNVVRWILGPSVQKDAETYSKDDLIYYINDYYYNEFLGHKDNNLYVVEFHDDLFKNMNYERKGSCYTIRKASPTTLVHPKDSHFISFESVGDLVGLATLFNKTERFYCYDNHTFLFTQAAMCGCISIVLPDPRFSKEMWINGSRLHKYGVAYGEDDIPRAIETLPLLLKEIEKVKAEMLEGVITFTENCQKYFK
jgi:hypothetical protein